MPVVVKKTCDQTIVEVYTCPAPDGTGGVPYIGVNVGNGVGAYKLTDQIVAPREHHFYSFVGINGTQVNLVGDEIQIEGGNYIEFASRAETDAGVITDKALNPDVGAYAYDRFRHAGQHSAGKGTAVVQLFPDANGVVVVNCALSNVFEVVFDRDILFADPVNVLSGQTVNIHLRQDVIGGRNATFSAAWTFTNRINPALTPDAGATDLLSCQWDLTKSAMRCSFLPNFGANYIPPPVYTEEDLVFANLGNGNEVFRDRAGLVVNFRTIVGGGDVQVTTVDDTIQVSYSPPPGQTIPQLINDLQDVEASPAIGDSLIWDGTNWVANAARKWTLGATWTNGPNDLAVPVNDVNAVVSEKCVILGWYLLTDGGSGSCVVDIRRIPVWMFPPVPANSIVGGDYPTISNAYMASDSDLIGWSTACEEGDLLQFALTSVSGFSSVQILLVVQRVP